MLESGAEVQEPDSAFRMRVRIQLMKNGKKLSAFIPNGGCLILLRKTMKGWLLDFITKVMLLVTFLESA